MGKMDKWLRALSTADLKAASYWPWQAQMLLFILICVFVAACGVAFWVVPAQKQLALKVQSEAEWKTRYQKRATDLADMAALMRQQAKLKIQLSDSLEMLPDHISTPDFVQTVTRLGTGSKLVFSSFEVGTLEFEAQWSALPFSLLLQGSYQNFIGFLEALLNLEQPVTLHDFEIRPHKDVPTLLELKINAKALHRSKAKSG